MRLAPPAKPERTSKDINLYPLDPTDSLFTFLLSRVFETLKSTMASNTQQRAKRERASDDDGDNAEHVLEAQRKRQRTARAEIRAAAELGDAQKVEQQKQKLLAQYEEDRKSMEALPEERKRDLYRQCLHCIHGKINCRVGCTLPSTHMASSHDQPILWSLVRGHVRDLAYRWKGIEVVVLLEGMDQKDAEPHVKIYGYDIRKYANPNLLHENGFSWSCFGVGRFVRQSIIPFRLFDKDDGGREAMVDAILSQMAQTISNLLGFRPSHRSHCADDEDEEEDGEEDSPFIIS